MKPTFFDRPAAFRHWLEKHHATATELWVGYYKKDAGKRSITWPESVDEALCYGWIDGIRKSIDEVSYMIRFTPRKPGSTWSTTNLQRIKELQKKGLLQPAGLAAFGKRDEKKVKQYSFEQDSVALPPAFEKKFQQQPKAWNWFRTQAPSYQKAATWWVISAKQESTQQKRLDTLIADSAAGLRVANLRRS